MEVGSGEEKAEIKKKDLSVVKAIRQLPLVEYFEAAIDFATDDELLSAVPVASTVVGTFKAFGVHRRRKLRKKAESFLVAASEGVSNEDADIFIKGMEGDAKEEFLENVLDIIDRAECEQKAMILGAALRRLIKSEIDYQVFNDHVQFTNYIPLVSIHHFMHAYHNEFTMAEFIGDNLVAQRLAKREISLVEITRSLVSQKKEQVIEVKYAITPIGKEYLKTLHTAYYEKIEPKYRLV